MYFFHLRVINVKLQFNYCIVNFVHLNNFCNCRIPDQQLYLHNTLSYWKLIEPHFFVLSILQFIWRDLAIASKSFNRRKKYVLIIETKWINRYSYWRRCSGKIDFLQNSCSTEYQVNCIIKIFEKYQWNVSWSL